MSPVALIALFIILIGASVLAAPRRASVEGFYTGSLGGQAPGLWVLVLSQVTTWIFARSLMNAAILGYFYGIAGTLAYAAYYGSFLTGGFIVARLRARGAHGETGSFQPDRRRFSARPLIYRSVDQTSAMVSTAESTWSRVVSNWPT